MEAKGVGMDGRALAEATGTAWIDTLSIDVLRDKLTGALNELHDVEEMLAAGLRYPRSDGGPDDPNGGGFVLGEHTAASLALEAKRTLGAGRLSRQAWAEEALRLQQLVEQIIADLREKLEDQRALTDKSPAVVGFTAGIAEALTWVQWIARPQEGALDSNRSFCACLTVDQLSKLGAGFTRPQCGVHPENGGE